MKSCNTCVHSFKQWNAEPCHECVPSVHSVGMHPKWEAASPADVAVANEQNAELRKIMDAMCVGTGVTKTHIPVNEIYNTGAGNTPEEMAKGGVKFDGDKPRMDLLDSYAIEQLAQVLTFGANKYASHNWRKGIAKSRLIAAALRHLFAYLRGEDKDPESGLSHVAHAMCCCMFLLGLEHRAELDDRYKEDL